MDEWRRDPWTQRVDDRWAKRESPYKRENVAPDGLRLLKVGRGDTLVFLTQAKLPPVANLFAPAAPTNVAGWVIWFTLKYQEADPDLAALAQINTTPSSTPPGGSITLTSATLGFVTVSVPPAATSNLPDAEVDLRYDVRGVDAGGVTYTIERGVLRVFPRPTRAV